jgi:hypothetical protein
VQEVTQKDFPLPTLGPKLLAIRDELVSGRGFYLIKGLPVQKWTREEAILAYWGLGTYWGHAVSQNGKGHLIGHVKVWEDQNIPSSTFQADSACVRKPRYFGWWLTRSTGQHE